MDIKQALASELEMLEERFRSERRQAVSLLEESGNPRKREHALANLTARVNEMSRLAGQITQSERILQAIEETEAAVKPTLTRLESEVLAAMRKQADDCSGGDFGIMDEVHVPSLSRKQLGGVVTSLQAKGQVFVSEPIMVNGTDRVVQFNFPD